MRGMTLPMLLAWLTLCLMQFPCGSLAQQAPHVDLSLNAIENHPQEPRRVLLQAQALGQEQAAVRGSAKGNKRGARYASHAAMLKQGKFPLSDKDYTLVDSTTFTERLNGLAATASRSVLAHVHVQKCSGTALAATLGSQCKCRAVRMKSLVGKTYKKEYCGACPQVKGAFTNFHMTVNRHVSKGGMWMCGVHPPLSVMAACLDKKLDPIPPRSGSSSSNNNNNQQQQRQLNSSAAAPLSDAEIEQLMLKRLQPVFVVMLREPWARFMSESRQCKITGAGEKLITSLPDWQAENNLDAGDRSEEGIINSLAQVPDRYMIQNRHLKMLGGRVQDFNMRYVPDPDHGPGSRWVGDVTDKYRVKLLSAAIKNLAMRQTVIIGISERFAESVCTLEALYGHLYKFEWEDDKHSHSLGRNAKNYTSSSKGDGSASDSAYFSWEATNRQEIALYEASTALFERQWAAVLQLLRSRASSRQLVPATVPHCLPFLP